MKNRNLSNNDNWATPADLYNKLNEEFNFDFDPCPLNEGVIKWDNDGLLIEWGKHVFFNFNWDNYICRNFVSCKNLNAQDVNKLRTSQPFPLGKTEKEDIVPSVKNANQYHLRPDQKQKENQNDLCLIDTNYFRMVFQDAQNVMLSNHLIKLILLLNQDVNQDLDLIVGLANVNTQKKIWQENVMTLKQRILLRLQKLNIEDLLKEEKDTEKEMLSEITYIEEILLTGLKNNGRGVNYTLETSVYIVDQKTFLLKTILSLYQVLIVSEQSKEILYHPVVNVTVQKDPRTQQIGVVVNPLQEYTNTSKVSIKLHHNAHCFINPPYTRHLKESFVTRAIMMMKKGKLCVMLLPVSTSTKLFHEFIQPNATEIRFLRGRVKFTGKNTKGELVSNKCGMHDSMIVVFDGRKKNIK